MGHSHQKKPNQMSRPERFRPASGGHYLHFKVYFLWSLVASLVTLQSIILDFCGSPIGFP